MEFVAYGLAIALVSNVHQSVAWRQFVLLAGSLGFLAFFTLDPLAFLPLAAFLCTPVLARGLSRTRLGSFVLTPKPWPCAPRRSRGVAPSSSWLAPGSQRVVRAT